MINSITIKNFETHLDTHMELHPGLNVVCGSSNKGKSGIIRALKLNIQNSPQGDGYRNDQLTDPKIPVQVKIEYDNGTILRERNSSFNHYKINSGQPLKALRSNVPQEIQDISRMKDINIQGQHPSEQYFLLSDNPGQVAKKFNEVAGLTIMDKAIAEINAQVRSTNSEINMFNEEIDNIKDQLKETAWVLKAKKLADSLKQLSSKIQIKSKKYSKLINILEELKHSRIELKKLEGIKEANIEIKKLEELFICKDKKAIELSILIGTVNDIKEADTDIELYKDTDNALNSLKQLEKDQKEIKNNKNVVTNLHHWLGDIVIVNEEIDSTVEELNKLQNEFNTMAESTECPTCGRKGKL